MAIMGNSDIYEICLAKAELSMWMLLFVVLQQKQNKRLFLGVIFILFCPSLMKLMAQLLPGEGQTQSVSPHKIKAFMSPLPVTTKWG